MKTQLIVFSVAFSLWMASPNLAWSQTYSSGQTQENSSDSAAKEKNAPKEEDKIFSPIQPTNEGNFLVLDQDGKSPIDHEKLLNLLDTPEKTPKR
jgi:hypothetical protein